MNNLIYNVEWRHLHAPTRSKCATRSERKNLDFGGSIHASTTTTPTRPAALTNGATLDVDPGVTINVLDIGYIHPSAKASRDTHLYLSALKDDYWMASCSSAEPVSRPIWMGYGDRDTSVLSPVLCNSSALTFKQVTSGQDTFTTFVPTYTSVSGVIIPIAAITDYRLGFKRMVPGEEISAQFSDSTNATPVAMVRTATSYYGMAADKSDTAQPQTFAKAVGGGTSVVPIEYLGMGTHASYAAWKSVWTIRVNTLRNFSILFNGEEVVNIDTDNEIIEAGFGGQGAVGGSITAVDWVSETGKPAAGPRPINIAFFGDSITAETFNGSWPTQLTKLLDQHYGLRVNFIQNYAVSGASSAAQLPLCTAPNIASYDVVCIMLGVNDIQGGVVEQDYATNLTSMINTCKAAGKKVVVGLPTMFYGQGQAGAGKGQATQRYDLGKGVRAKCLRTCADLGVPVVNTWGHMGPVLADWINPALNSLANLGHDPMVFDSIHPTQFGKLVLARAFAAKIAGLFMRTSTLRTSLVDLPATNLSNGWTFSGQYPQWMRNDAGVVTLSGFMLPGATAAGTVIYTLPENIRPKQTGRYACRADTGTAALDIDATTGQVTVYNWPAGAGFVALDTIGFPSR
jgi:lysophospholipase L1-like esterase